MMESSLLLETENPFLSSLHASYENVPKDDAIRAFRARAWERFLEIGLPSKKWESYRYVPLKNLYGISVPHLANPNQITQEEIAPHILAECKDSLIVFVNGKLSPELTCMSALKHCTVWKSLNDAYRTYGTFLNHHFNRLLKEEPDPFALLNLAMSHDSAFLYIPPKAEVNRSIQILNFVTEESCFPRLQLFAGALSKVDIISTKVVQSREELFVNTLFDFSLDEGAKVTYRALGNGANAYHLDFLRASLKKNSFFRSVNHTTGSKLFRNDLRVALNGENAEALLYGLWELKDKKEAHTHVFVEHKAPFCKSLQLFKGVLDDFSRSSFEGKIYVQRDAQKTDAFQLNNHLFLSDHVIANSKPNLEIFADDVKASHGATFGKLSEEALFYLRSRGVSKEVAKKLQTLGFTREILEFFEGLL